MRRKRSRASGAGLDETLMTPISKASLRGFRRLFCSFFPVVSFMLRSRSGGFVGPLASRYRSFGWAAGHGRSGRAPGGVVVSYPAVPPMRRLRRRRGVSASP